MSESGGDCGGGVLDYEAEVREILGEGAGCVACGTANLVGVRAWVGSYGRGWGFYKGEENVHLLLQPRRVGKPSRSQ